MSTSEINQEIEMLKMNVEIWKTIIDTQKHFNDLEMKVRNYAILILSAFIGAIGVSFNSGYKIIAFSSEIQVATILSFAAAFVWSLFYFMDVIWYHPLLIGAVKKGRELENELTKDFPNINLTEKIGNESPKKFLFMTLHSTQKAHLFYLSILFVLLFSSVLFFRCFSANTLI